MNDCIGEEQTELVTAIAKKHLRIGTLKEQKSDRLDFHEVSVWELESALKEALRTGIDIGIEMTVNHVWREKLEEVSREL